MVDLEVQIDNIEEILDRYDIDYTYAGERKVNQSNKMIIAMVLEPRVDEKVILNENNQAICTIHLDSKIYIIK